MKHALLTRIAHPLVVYQVPQIISTVVPQFPKERQRVLRIQVRSRPRAFRDLARHRRAPVAHLLPDLTSVPIGQDLGAAEPFWVFFDDGAELALSPQETRKVLSTEQFPSRRPRRFKPVEINVVPPPPMLLDPYPRKQVERSGQDRRFITLARETDGGTRLGEVVVRVREIDDVVLLVSDTGGHFGFEVIPCDERLWPVGFEALHDGVPDAGDLVFLGYGEEGFHGECGVGVKAGTGKFTAARGVGQST